MSRRAFLLIVALLMTSSPAVFAGDGSPSNVRWVISAQDAKKLIESGEATVLDTRGKLSWLAGHVPNSHSVKWKDFTRSDKPHRGVLLGDDAALTKKLQALGVSKGRPVVVVGKPPKNWGEDGRIVWMLHALGHPNAALVSGGERALEKAGLDTTLKLSHTRNGDFVVHRNPAMVIGRDQLKKKLGSKDLVVIDTREQREYDGKTPYGESRGGHVPGAVHLYYKDLMRPDGRLLPRAALEKKLKALGITPDKTVVSYCTGGVRSGWMTVVLRSLGYKHALNYAGSMWEWSASPAKKFPLAK